MDIRTGTRPYSQKLLTQPLLPQRSPKSVSTEQATVLGSEDAQQVTAQPTRSLKGLMAQHLGMYTVKFQGAPPLSEKELQKLNEDINDINTSVRLSAIRKLYDQPEIKDTRILRSLGRYLFYNDTYYPLGSERVQARLWTIKLLEKNKAIWGAEGLYNNLRELGNRNIASYAALVLGKLIPNAPEWMQDRYRARLYDWVISTNSSNAPDFSAKILAEVAPKKDANYIWYLIDMPGVIPDDATYDVFTGSGTSSTIRKRLSAILGNILAKETGYSGFKSIAEEFSKIYAENEDDRDNRDLRYKKRLLAAYLSVLPEVPLRTPPATPTENKNAFNLILDVYVLLKQTDALSDQSQKKYAKTLGHLILKQPPAERKELINRLMSEVSKTPEDKELVASLFEGIYNGDFNRKEILEDYLDKKYYNTSDFPNTVSTWTRELKARIAQVQANNAQPDAPENYAPLLDEPDLIFRKPTYTRRIQERVMDYNSFSFNPAEIADLETTESLFGFKLEEPSEKDWTPKFTPAVEPPMVWDLEAFTPRESSREVDFYMGMNQQLKRAIGNDARSEMQDVLFRTMQVWLNDKSRAAYDVLKENLGNPTLFDQFSTILWRLNNDKLKRVPPKQLLSLFRQAAPTSPLKTGNQGEMFRTLMSWQAKNNPELRGELLLTSLDMFKNTATDSPARGEVARTVFNMLKFGIPDFVVQQHKDTLKEVLSQLTSLYKMDSSSYRRDIDWAFFSNTTWETSSSDDRINMDQKKNFDLMLQLASRIGDRDSLEKGVSGLFTYFEQVRRNSYADEIFIIRYLRDPKVAEAALNTQDDSVFQAYREMVAWYKVFEAVPAMVKKAAEGPLRATAWIQGTITALDFYAVPELEKIIKNTTNGRERAFAKEALDMILEPKRPSEMFKPFPYGLPEPFGRNPGQTGNNNTPVDTKNSTQINFPGLLTDGPQKPPVDNPTDPINPTSPTDTTQQVRFPGLMGETDTGNNNTATPSYMELMDRALTQIRSDDPEVRTQALEDLVFFANQFREVSSGSNSRIPFVTAEKTALVNVIAGNLVGATEYRVKRAYLSTLGNLQDPACFNALITFLAQEPDSTLKRQAIGILGSLGRAQAQPLLRRISLNDQESMDVRQQAMAALIRLDDREALVTLAKPNYDAGALADENGGLGPFDGGPIDPQIRQSAIQGIGELRIDTPEARAVLLEALAQSSAGSPLKAATINALGQMADANDAEISVGLIAAAAATETPAVKMAVINAFEFLDYTDGVRELMGRLRQDSDYNVSRAAAQFQLRRANG